MIPKLLLLLLLHLSSILWLLFAVAASPSKAKPGCQEKCGNISIPFPFGIGEGCYLDEWYAMTCNNNDSSFNNKLPMPILSKFNLEVLKVSLHYQTLTFNSPLASNCPPPNGTSTSTIRWTSTDLTGSPFTFSTSFNDFVSVGCDNAFLTYGDDQITAGCTSTCQSKPHIDTNGCNGINCCKTSIPRTSLDYYFYTLIIDANGSTSSDSRYCTSAFLAEDGWFQGGNVSTPGVTPYTEFVPVNLDWGIPIHLSGIEWGRFPNYECDSRVLPNCRCQSFYEGNAFIPNGCKVAEACANCNGECISDGKKYYCSSSRKTNISIGTILVGGLLPLLLSVFCLWLYKYMKKRKITKLKEKHFKRNGGLLLQQQMLSDEETAEKTRIFTWRELEIATDDFNQNRILGQGGQGTVYKGMMTNGKIVAVKRSKMVDESQLEQFINEVVILSQINHRNIVKLLGCCLETEVPLLVYEFVSNGNLFQLIHDQNEDFPFSWKMRIQVATEVAGALAYLHSASYVPIFHRDIKSTNILLDEKYRAIVSDFGTSRSISIEKTHLTTLVCGTFGYLDPEYFRSSQFTEKSDVYSFGVVLVELLTGQKPVSSLASEEEEKSLVNRFITSLKQAKLFDMIDSRVIEEAGKEEIIVVADIAKRCLSLNGKKRPTMNEVMMGLEGIRMSHMPVIAPPDLQENECAIEINGHGHDVTFHDKQLSLDYEKSSFSREIDPLLFNTV